MSLQVMSHYLQRWSREEVPGTHQATEAMRSMLEREARSTHTNTETAMVRAKFTVQEVRQSVFNPTARTLVLRPQYDTSIPEDQRFFSATPTGEMTMVVNNPAALAEMELGKSFYVDFTPVE